MKFRCSGTDNINHFCIWATHFLLFIQDKNLLDKERQHVRYNTPFKISQKNLWKCKFEKKFPRNLTKRNFQYELFAKILLGATLPRVWAERWARPFRVRGAWESAPAPRGGSTWFSPAAQPRFRTDASCHRTLVERQCIIQIYDD